MSLDYVLNLRSQQIHLFPAISALDDRRRINRYFQRAA
jgi:hypothetical protein